MISLWDAGEATKNVFLHPKKRSKSTQYILKIFNQ